MDAKPLRSVLIVGGGLGGLVLANALRGKPDLQVTIFERDVDEGIRQQGFILGVNDKGTEALLKLQIPDLTEFISKDKSRMHYFKLTDANYNKLMVFGGQEGCLVERWRLRQILLQGLKNGGEYNNINVAWGKKFVRYVEDDVAVEVFFEDGTSAKGDILIGADGAHSRVRAQRTKDIVYEQVPVGNVGGWIPAPPRPTLGKLQDAINGNLIRAFGIDGVSLLAMPYTSQDNQQHIVYALTFPCTDELKEIEDIKSYLLEKAAKVNQDAVELIKATPMEETIGRFVHTCRLLNNDPLGKTTRVTLMGDAAHAMTSHAGLGGNTAFLDAIDLAKALSSTNWYTELAQYEKVMIKRGYENVKISYGNTQRITKAVGETGAKVRNWFMWTVGLFMPSGK